MKKRKMKKMLKASYDRGYRDGFVDAAVEYAKMGLFTDEPDHGPVVESSEAILAECKASEQAAKDEADRRMAEWEAHKIRPSEPVKPSVRVQYNGEIFDLTYTDKKKK